MKKWLLSGITHAIALAAGFAGGIYALPILTAPAAPSAWRLCPGVHSREDCSPGSITRGRAYRQAPASLTWL